MRRHGYFLLAAAIAVPVHAGNVSVNVPAGRAGEAAAVIARQTGTSVVITDPEVANRQVPAIRGKLSTKGALQKLAKAAGAKLISAGAAGWRLVPETRSTGATVQASRRSNSVARAPAPKRPPPRQAPAEDIVVVGSKREIVVAEYAGEVQMIAGEELNFGGAGGTEKIAQRAPALSSTQLGSGRNKLFIRGIADSSFTGPTQSTVGQYFGDLRLSYNAPDPDLRLSDLDRVEILEGPQGTLYGAGALGGILRLVPNPPQLGVSGGSIMVGGSLTQHGGASADGSATINVPLTEETVALRASLDAASFGGYIDKPLLGKKDVNRTDIVGGRVALRLDAGEGWSVDFIGIGQATDGHDSQYADREGPPLTRASRVNEGFEADFAQGQVVVSGEFGDVLFRSSTGYTVQDLDERYDATLPEGPLRQFRQSNSTRMFANETRLWQPARDRFGWLLGASYVSNRNTLTRSIGSPDTQAPATGVRNDVDEVTLYGEASWRVTENLVASAGGRFTYSWLGGAGEDVSPLLASAGAAITAQRSESAFLPSASLVAQVMPETSVYLRYQEGFRPGGLAIAGDFVSRFRNDHIATLELGVRHGQAGRGPFDLSANISYTRWSDIQADFLDSAGLPSTANIGDGRIWSATANAGVGLSDDLRLEASLTYNDSRIDEPSPLLDFLGRAMQVPNIARFAGRIGFDYWRPLDGDLVLAVQGWAHYVGKSRLGVGPELGELQGDYIDSGLTARLGTERMGITLGLTNITDEVGNRFALGTPFAIGRGQITPLRPRTLRIGFDAAF